MNDKNLDPPLEVTGRKFNPMLFFLALFAPGIIMLSIPLVYDPHGTGFDFIIIYLAVLIPSSAVASGFCCWQLTLCHPSFSTEKKVLFGLLYFIACLASTIFLGYVGGVIGITSSSPYA